MRIFDSVQPQSEYTSMFLNITIFQKTAIFGDPSSTLGEIFHVSIFNEYEQQERLQ